MRRECDEEFDGGASSAHPCGAVGRIDVDGPEVADVDDDATLGTGMAGNRVAATTYGEFQPVVPCIRNSFCNVIGVGHADYGAGLCVDPTVNEGASLLVIRVVGTEDGAGKAG